MFLEMFTKLLNENGLNKRQFSIKSGIPYTTIDGFYKKGYENIRLTTLRKIAEYFDVSLDYLIFGKEKNNDNEQLLDIQKYYNILNEIGKKKAISYLEDLADNPKYTAPTVGETVIKDIDGEIVLDVMNVIKQAKSRV